jgi:hypothetical protein
MRRGRWHAKCSMRLSIREETFPASDPPSYMPGTYGGAGPGSAEVLRVADGRIPRQGLAFHPRFGSPETLRIALS